jgi:hypothetical protein
LCPMLPVSLEYSLSISPFVFTSVYWLFKHCVYSIFEIVTSN